MRQSPLIPLESPIRRLRHQRRFVRDTLTILVPQTDYYVQAECCRALEALGHRVVRVAIGARGESLEHGEVLRRLMHAVVEHRPDMLLTINYTGFDRAGYFDEILQAMGLPTAVWFVDNPFFLAEGFLRPDPATFSGFVWDRSYVPVLRAHGMTDVTHLPLGTCRHVFASGSAGPAVAPLSLCFVGHSLAKIEKLWQAVVTPAQEPRAQAAARALAADRSALHEQMGSLGPPVDPAIRPVALGNYRASRALRARTLRALPQAQLHIFGDDAWKQALPKAHVHGSCTYGPETVRIFRHAAININVTNLQMPTTGNQRVFDVPAAGAFLLTDRQEEVADWYEEGREVVTFASPEELADKAAYFARRPHVRQEIVARAHARTLAEHTYEHRMQRLLASMRRKHGRPQVAARKTS